MPKVSIIIPINQINSFLREAIPHHLNQSFQDFEILIFTDNPEKESWDKTRIIPTGKVSPPEKRDFALTHAQGEYLAFIDDDAYPAPGWLSQALPTFKNSQIAAVCGPGITPEQNSTSQKTGGYISASPLGGWGCTDRFIPGEKKEVDDWASMNLIVRKSDFEAVGGYGVTFWPGEDTKLCLDLTHQLGKKIIYDPAVVVYHHRRALWKPHLIQNGRFGLHRGHFARIYPETSRRLSYFIPSLFVLYLLLLPPLYLLPGVDALLIKIASLPFFAYLLLLLLNSLWVYAKSGSFTVTALSIPGVLATHTWYGIRFIQGLLTGKIRKNRSDAL